MQSRVQTPPDVLKENDMSMTDTSDGITHITHPIEVRKVSSTGGQKGQKDARFDLISWQFLWQLAMVCGFGAKKYDDDNWRKGYSWRLSYGAMQRHLTQFWTGQLYDDESGVHHLAHAAWHCMVLFIFSTVARYKCFDDRPDMPLEGQSQ